MMRITISVYLWIGLLGFNPVFAQTPKDFSTNFEYDLKLSVDATKRAAYLKKMNEQPSPYEKVFTVISGSVQVANITDQVKFTGATYQITSVGSLIAGMSTALGGQRLVRESQGTLSPTGMASLVYQEKRGNTDLLISRYEAPKKSITFFKTSFRNSAGSAPLEGQCSIPRQADIPKVLFSAFAR